MLGAGWWTMSVGYPVRPPSNRRRGASYGRGCDRCARARGRTALRRGAARGGGDRPHGRGARLDRGRRLRALAAGGVGSAAPRLRQHRSLLREGARPAPGADLPRAPSPAVRGDAGQGGDVPLPDRPRLPLRRGRADGGARVHAAARRIHGRPRDRAPAGDAAHDRSRHAPLVPGRRPRAPSSPSSRRRAATSSTSSRTNA